MKYQYRVNIILTTHDDNIVNPVPVTFWLTHRLEISTVTLIATSHKTEKDHNDTTVQLLLNNHVKRRWQTKARHYTHTLTKSHRCGMFLESRKNIWVFDICMNGQSTVNNFIHFCKVFLFYCTVVQTCSPPSYTYFVWFIAKKQWENKWKLNKGFLKSNFYR